MTAQRKIECVHATPKEGRPDVELAGEPLVLAGLNTAVSELAASAVRFALMSGLPIEEINDVTGLSPQELIGEGPVRDDLPPRIFGAILARGLDSAPALFMAKSGRVTTTAVMNVAWPYAPTPLDALQLSAEFSTLLADRESIRLETSRNFVAIHFWHPCDPLDNGLIHEVEVIKHWWLARDLMGRHARLSEVSLGFSSNATKAAYDEAFGVPVSFGRFGHEHTLVFHKEDLNVDSVGGNADLFRLGRLYLQERRRLDQTRHVSVEMRRLVETITSCVARSVFRVDQVARAASMSVRAAQRVASQQGTTPLKLIQSARLDHARAVMAEDPTISNAKLAATLGYKTQSSLNREFRRRTGLSLDQFKQVARIQVQG